VRSAKRPGRGSQRRRSLASGTIALLASASLLASVAPGASAASTGQGKQIAQGGIVNSTTARAHFHNVRPARSFLLTLTAPLATEVNVVWTITCYSQTRKTSGGATGLATVTSGHWSKLVRANWIKNPASCSGSVVGSDESASPNSGALHIHIYAR
jgi:hypothetical protein